MYTVPIGMKKSRPGVLLACLCREEDAGKLAEAILPPHHHPGGPPNEPRPHSAPPQLPHRPDPWGPVTVKETPWRGEKAGIRGGGSHRPPGGPHPGRSRRRRWSSGEL